MIHSDSSSPLSIRLSFIFFAVVTILTGMIAGNMPLIDDDIVFADSWGCVKHTICPEEDFNPWSYAMDHRNLTNGRIGDMFTPLFVMFPRVVYGVVYALSYGIVILLMMRIAKISFTKNPKKIMCLTAFTVLLFPWIDVFYTRAVFFNYFPAVIFALISLLFFISERRLRGWRLAGCIIIGFLTGCWHELMPVALLPSAIIYCLITRKITSNQWIVIISITAGVSIVVSAPSFFNRVDQLPHLYFNNNRIILAYLYTFALIILNITSIILLHTRTKHQKESTSAKALVYALAMPTIPSCVIMLSSLYETRICFLTMILAIASLFYSLPRRRFGKSINSVAMSATALLAVAITAHLAYVVYDTIKVRRASEAIMAQAAANPDAPIYYDLSEIVADDAYNLYKTQGRGYINKLHSWEDFSHYTDYRYSFNVLPPALKDFDLAKAEPVDSANGIYYYKDYLIAEAPCDSTHYINGVIETDYADGTTKHYQFMGAYFNDVNGKPLIYVLPYHPRMPRKKPAGARITDYSLNQRIMR